MGHEHEPLTPETITKIVHEATARRRNYITRIAYVMGMTEWELTRRYVVTRHLYLKPRKPSREHRLINILRKRYNVPESLVVALVDEIESHF